MLLLSLKTFLVFKMLSRFDFDCCMSNFIFVFYSICVGCHACRLTVCEPSCLLSG